MNVPIVVGYGGGTNSTAVLVGLHEREERPDLILFADTGGEKPNTYAHVAAVSDWCVSVGFPPIVTVKYKRETLEENCIRTNSLPSIAYGFKKCSLKFKKEPQDQYLNNWQPAKDAWKNKLRVSRLIGFDADEPHRAHRVADRDAVDKKFSNRYPLLEWDWGRDECVQAIHRAGLPQPGKSACFFCPSSKKPEILALAIQHPHLAARAISMEQNAQLTSVKGLGRRFSWEMYFINEEQELAKHIDPCEVLGPLPEKRKESLFCDMDFSDAGKETDCGCYDGE